jgi:hypothetical protein
VRGAGSNARPYRDPIPGTFSSGHSWYILSGPRGALLIVFGEAWLFVSADLVLYAALLAVAFHVLVVGYEEPTLRARFGEPYETYRRTVSRWIPRPPR